MYQINTLFSLNLITLYDNYISVKNNKMLYKGHQQKETALNLYKASI